MSSETTKRRIERFGLAGRQERMQSPQIIQPTQAIRHRTVPELLGRWSFAGGVALDLTGRGNDGTFYGSATATGHYLEVNGAAGSYLDFGTPEILQPSFFTWMAWLWFDNNPGGYNAVIWGRQDSVYYGGMWNGIYVYQPSASSKIGMWIRRAGGVHAGWSSNTSIGNSQWRHVAISWDGLTIRWYIMGALDKEHIPWTGPPKPLAWIGHNIRAGAGWDGDDPLDGRIDDLRVYNRALAQWEIQLAMETEYKGTMGCRAFDAYGPIENRGSLNQYGVAYLNDINIANNGDVTFSSQTGSKIGTGTDQKIGFFNKTPTSQPATVGDPSGGGTIDAEARSSINDIIDRLQQLGLIA